ncbi:MAG TPA: hypothetical protein VHN80_28025, partial [Kineosporiaceae bacterium]|nr:hypothetical protein [Kineosporiaceae bacterium]
MDRLQRLRWWLVVQGRRVPLWLVVVVTPLVVSAVAYDLAAPGSWLRSGEVLGGRLFNLPPVGLVAAGIALIVLVCTRWLVRGSREGPITVDRIVDATLTRATRAPDKSSAALTVSAILRSRLAIAGRGHPAQQGTDVRSIVPSYGAVDLTTETPVAGAPEDTYGLLARLGIRFWRTATQRLGWRIHGTLRHGLDDGTKFGLSFVVEHVATGRHDLTATVWGNSAQEVARAAAYQIASWRLQRLSPASTRKTPQWRPNAAALQDYEDATYYGAQRRFDEAVDRARKALNLDPANMLARRLLGETYEWLGHFENAMHTYASGLVMLFDDENGWSPTALVKDDPDHPLKGWPVHDADPLPVSRQA